MVGIAFKSHEYLVLRSLILCLNDFFLSYTLESDDQKILAVHMSTPISHGEITGKMVKILFSSEHNIQTALTRVFAEKPQPASPSKVLAYYTVLFSKSHSQMYKYASHTVYTIQLL